MTEEIVLKEFKEILAKLDMNESISIGSDVNEIADIMIYQEKGDVGYLAKNGTVLFPVYYIRNILYKFGENRSYIHPDAKIQFIIKLSDDVSYVLEYGDNRFYDAMFVEGGCVTEDEKIKEHLVRYNQKIIQRMNMDCIVASVFGIVEGKERIEDEELKEVREKVDNYLKENQEDVDFLLSFAHSCLQMFVYEDVDLFNIKHVIKKIVDIKCENDFLNYIRRWDYDSKDYRENGYYLGLIAGALRVIREIKKTTVEGE